MTTPSKEGTKSTAERALDELAAQTEALASIGQSPRHRAKKHPSKPAPLHLTATAKERGRIRRESRA